MKENKLFTVAKKHIGRAKKAKEKGYYYVIYRMFIKVAEPLEISFFNIVLCIYFPFPYFISKILKSKNKKNIIAFAGLQYSGNLKPIYEEMRKDKNLITYFVTKDKEQIKNLRSMNIDAYYIKDITKIPLFLNTDVWVTTHLETIPPGLFKWKTKVVDIYHGIATRVHQSPFFIDIFYDYYSKCDNIYVSSEYLKKIHVSWGASPEKIKITGYARTDILINKKLDKEKIIREMKIPQGRKNILYAPTWGHQKPSIFLRDINCAETIFARIDAFCEENNCNFIIRTHPIESWDNVLEKGQSLSQVAQTYKHLIQRPAEKYPNSVEEVYISDVLITDWSGIFADYILLKKPIIFLDVELPKGQTISPDDRCGYIVKTKKELLETLEESLSTPHLFDEKRAGVIEKFYGKKGKYADGNATRRCAEEIIKLIKRA